jgi:asparagine synthase (glutamine-hydrolysing)
MCGIAGLWDRNAATGAEPMGEAIAAMTATLHHRGPDDRGAWVDAPAGIALGHTRLAVVDLSPAGAQPMVSDDGRMVLVFNGEIYNAAELRPELVRAGKRFRGRSDTEVLVEALAAWGVPATLERAIGMFAFAAWDRRDRKLVLARDRLGKKPLYWSSAGELVTFGSELKALLAGPAAPREVDRDALAAFLRWRFVPSPQCIYRGVRKLPAGHWLEIDARGAARLTAYWDPVRLAGGEAEERPDAEVVDELDLLLQDAVRCRMIADVPIGAFLSGGVDSSLITALMQAQSAQPIRTFSIGFREAGFDEAPFARAVADRLGTQHTEFYVTADQALDLIPTLPRVFDEPFADASQIPTCLLSSLTRRHVTVTLSGDGGDELFAGYRRYQDAMAVWRKLGRVPAPLRRLGRGILGAILAADTGLLARQGPLPATERLEYWSELLASDGFDWFYRQRSSQWRRPESLVCGGRDGLETGCPVLPAGLDPLLRMQLSDLLGYLPDDILTKVDRASMASALEVRAPLLDHRVVERALRLPRQLKLRDSKGKWILNRVLARYLPEELFQRPKAGFSVPLGGWLRGPLRGWAESLLDEGRLRTGGYLKPGPIRRRWDQHLAGERNWQAHLWSVLMFQAWLEDQGLNARRPSSLPAGALQPVPFYA